MPSFPFRTALLPTATAAMATAFALPLAVQPAHAAQSVDQSWRVPSRATLVISGHGYGHGHGMSQYGAKGAAEAGKGPNAILRHYYPGTRAGSTGGHVQVHITADTTKDLIIRRLPGTRVRNLGNGKVWRLPALSRRWKLDVAQDGRTVVAYRDGGWKRWRTFAGNGAFDRRHGAPVPLVTPSGTVQYRGRLIAAAPSAGSSDRDTVNGVSLENYLKGVVPTEMPATWPRAAVRSQAIAARTYAAYERARPLADHYQICDTTSCQVYGGASAEHPDSNAAVTATEGRIRTHRGEAAFTQFNASSGGWLSSGSAPYLVAKKDPYDGDTDNPYHSWTERIGAAKVERAFPAVGDLRRIRVTERDGNGEWKGRISSMTLSGSGGSVTVSGDSFRSALGLRSTWITFRVR